MIRNQDQKSASRGIGTDIARSYFAWSYQKSNLINMRSKRHLLAVSSMALKLCQFQLDKMISFERLHEIHKRATPTKMMHYRLAIQLYKIYNGKIKNDNWIDLNFQQNFNDKDNHVQINDVSKLRIGKQIDNEYTKLHKQQVYISWLKKLLDSFKIH